MTVPANRWHEIWSRKGFPPAGTPSHADLLGAAGWDIFGGVTEQAFLDYVEHVGRQLSIEPGDSILEVGCGAGAFLYPWHRRGHRVAGIDYAEGLVALARAAMPNASFEVGDASQLRAGVPFDIVVSNGVFHYFGHHDYAAAVLRRMAEVADKAIGVLDVADEARREAAVQRRREQLGAAEYEKQYAGLDHLYYRRQWFSDVLRDLDVTVTVEDQCLEGYFNNQDRFNVFIRRSRRRPPAPRT